MATGTRAALHQRCVRDRDGALDGGSALTAFGVCVCACVCACVRAQRGVEILRDFVPRHYGELRTGGGAHKGTSSDGRCLETALVRGLEKVDEELRLDGETCKEVRAALTDRTREDVRWHGAPPHSLALERSTARRQ